MLFCRKTKVKWTDKKLLVKEVANQQGTSHAFFGAEFAWLREAISSVNAWMILLKDLDPYYEWTPLNILTYGLKSVIKQLASTYCSEKLSKLGRIVWVCDSKQLQKQTQNGTWSHQKSRVTIRLWYHKKKIEWKVVSQPCKAHKRYNKVYNLQPRLEDNSKISNARQKCARETLTKLLANLITTYHHNKSFPGSCRTFTMKL